MLKIIYLLIWVELHGFYTHKHVPTNEHKKSGSSILTSCILYSTYVIPQ